MAMALAARVPAERVANHNVVGDVKGHGNNVSGASAPCSGGGGNRHLAANTNNSRNKREPIAAGETDALFSKRRVSSSRSALVATTPRAGRIGSQSLLAGSLRAKIGKNGMQRHFDTLRIEPAAAAKARLEV